jgi:hypothetical protein
MDFVDEGEEGYAWMRHLHKAFFEYFKRWDSTHNLDGTPK